MNRIMHVHVYYTFSCTFMDSYALILFFFLFSDFVCVVEMNVFQLALRLCNKTDMTSEASKVQHYTACMPTVYACTVEIFHLHVYNT